MHGTSQRFPLVVGVRARDSLDAGAAGSPMHQAERSGMPVGLAQGTALRHRLPAYSPSMFASCAISAATSTWPALSLFIALSRAGRGASASLRGP